MSKQLTKTETEEKKELLKNFYGKLDKDLLKATAEAISMFVRAFEGKPIEAEDIITRLINVKKIWERSRFPTYPLLARNVYLRLLHWKYGDVAEVCEKWADFEAESLISYKGQGRGEYVEMTKHLAGPAEEQKFYFNPPGPQEKKQRFSRFRKPQSEETEFINQ